MSFSGDSFQETLQKRSEDKAILRCWQDWTFNFNNSMGAERHVARCLTFKHSPTSRFLGWGWLPPIHTKFSFALSLECRCIASMVFVGPLVCCLELLLSWSLMYYYIDVASLQMTMFVIPSIPGLCRSS